MPRKSKREREHEETVEVEVDDDARDFVMARLAAGRAASQAAINAIDEATHLFINPDEDDDGSEREELLDEALEAAGVATRALEAAETKIKEIDPEAGEPWDEEGD